MIIFKFNLRIKVLAVLLFLTSFIICAFGQSFSGEEKKGLNESIFELLENYEQFSINRNGISADENVLNNVFSVDAKLYNDIIPANNRVNDISVADYIFDLNYFYRNGLPVIISNVQIGEPQRMDKNQYKLTLNLDKAVSGYTEYGIKYEEVFNLDVYVSFIKDSSAFSNFKIDKIIGNPEGRFVTLKFVNRTDKEWSGLPIIVNHRAYESNDKGEVYLDKLPNRDVIIAVKLGWLNKEDVILKNEDSFHLDSLFAVNNRTIPSRIDPNVKKFVVKELNHDFKLNVAAIVPYTNTFGFGETIESANGRPEVKLKNKIGGGFQVGFEIGQRIVDRPSFDIYLRTGFKYTYSYSVVEFSHDGNEYYTIHNDTITSFQYRSALQMFEVPIGIEFIKSFNGFDLMIKPAVHLSMNDKGNYTIKGDMVNDDNVLNASEIDSRSTRLSIMPRENAKGVKVNYNLFLGFGKDIGNNWRLYGGPNFYMGNSFNTTYWPTPYTSTIDDLSAIRTHLNKIKIRSVMLELGFRKKF
jgi:hypothetical protein